MRQSKSAFSSAPKFTLLPHHLSLSPQHHFAASREADLQEFLPGLEAKCNKLQKTTSVNTWRSSCRSLQLIIRHPPAFNHMRHIKLRASNSYQTLQQPLICSLAPACLRTTDRGISSGTQHNSQFLMHLRKNHVTFCWPSRNTISSRRTCIDLRFSTPHPTGTSITAA